MRTRIVGSVSIAVVMGCVLLLVPVFGAAAEAPVPISASVRAALDAATASATGSGAGSAPAISIAIVENDKLEYENASGMANIDGKRAATNATRFHIGSITKMFTAVAMMQLVEQGKIALDDKLARYLPKAPHADAVTIRELLTHTSGIPNYLDSALANGSAAKPATPEDLIDSVAKDPLDFAPGAHYEYSNTGYVLLGMVVQRISGITLSEYIKRNILEPAEMKETTFGIANPDLPVALGYADAAGKTARSFDPSWFYAVGDVLSTAPDLARFDIALMDGKLLRPETLALMQSNPVPTGDAKDAYGLGLQIFPFGDKTLTGHHGGMPGFASDNEMIVGDHFAVIVLGNSSRFQTSRVMGRVLGLLFPVASNTLKTTQAAPSAPADGEDPAVTTLMRRFLADFQHGTVDRSVLSSAMNNALTPQALASATGQFGPLGALQSTVYRGKSYVNGLVVYKYEGTFTSQRLPITFTLDKDGKIAGFFFQ